jgi:hypothetical protein
MRSWSWHMLYPSWASRAAHLIGVKWVVAAGHIRLVQPNMSQNTLIVPYKRRHTTSYNLHASYLAPRAICFKYRGQLKQRLIGFQSMTPKTTQNGKCFCAYRHSVALGPIIGSTRSTQGADTWMHARPMRQCVSKSNGLPIDVPLCFYYFQHAHHCVQKARGSWSMLHTTSTTFHTRLLSRIKGKWLHRYVLQI